MKYFDAHFTSLINHDVALVVGIAGGRVNYSPRARWLYSLRFMLLIFKVEILWTTHENTTTIPDS